MTVQRIFHALPVVKSQRESTVAPAATPADKKRAASHMNVDAALLIR